ncbi:MAG: molybdopterin molybdotransferase MoeA [Cyclobacteriaceae bacterium]|nr:molybdopterin molybdotransferase MoeA [Cyclobacteriaceae bacterium]
MVSVSEATSLIQEHLFKPSIEQVPITKAIGRVLVEPIKADRDFPPFHRVAMDGIAIHFETFKRGFREFPIEGTQAAGQPGYTLRDNQNCIEVMTGALLPYGTDTVIRYEDVDIKNGIAIVKAGVLVEPRQSIHAQAADARQGETLLSPSTRLAASEIALLASVGKSTVEIFSFPKTAIISTGNELVAIDATPLDYQIRTSNSYSIQAALSSMGCSSDIFHIKDDRSQLEKNLTNIINQYELIILTGGVSKGKFDFVPMTLESLGIQKHFHQVSQKPGKPFWFGSSNNKTVFALPGNPVSTFLCFYRYIRPWLERSMGLQSSIPQVILGQDFKFKAELTYFLQVKTKNESGLLIGQPIAGGGSGDFANLKDVDGFLELPATKSEFKKGEPFDYYGFR